MAKELIFVIVIFQLLLLLQTSQALWFHLPATGNKCVSEDIDHNVVVLADYYVVVDDHTDPPPAVSVKVTSPYGDTIHHKDNVTHGQFAFTSGEEGIYEACFSVSRGHGERISVKIDWKTGIATKDWDSIAKKENFEGVELELRKLEDAVKSIHDNLLYLKKREAKMRRVSEKTNSRIARFSIISLSICIGVSALQVWHLKTYFQKKKLI